MLIRYFLILFFFIFSSSCQNNPVDFVNISFSPAQQYEIRNSGEIISFSIRLSSNNELSELLIVEIVNNSIIDTVLTRTIEGLEKTELYNYVCPEINASDTTEIKLIFYCSNNNGDITERAKVFQVISSNILLNETSGHVMFSANNLSEHHAFDLLIPESVSYYDSTAHIFDITDSSTTILRRRWETFSDIEFAKSNNFNYAIATTQSSQNHYNSLDKKEFVDNIESNDIIFTKINNKIIVIKVTLVIDVAGNYNDKYIFNIKQ